MAMTRERRTALACLQVASAKLQTAKLACKETEDETTKAELGTLMQGVVEAVEAAMAELKS